MDAEHILALVGDPAALEALYRRAPDEFAPALMAAYQRHPDEPVLRVWHARLAADQEEVPQRRVLAGRPLAAAIAVALGCGLLVRVPAIWLGPAWYYPRFAPLWVGFALAFYVWLGRRDRRLLAAGAALAVFAAAFVSLLPRLTDSVRMALIHLPILYWLFLGVVFAGACWRQTEARSRFLRYNGELLILGSLVGLGGLVFSAITVALFKLIAPHAPQWYFPNVGVLGAAAIPVAATFLHQTVFQERTAIAAVLARVFSPLFLAMTGTYLFAALATGRNPFVDRAVLITVNALLLTVLGILVLSIAARGEHGTAGWADRADLGLLALTVLIDVLALAAIVFRLATYGCTPNRVVVLGANGVILVHLMRIARAQLRFVRGTAGVEQLRGAAVDFLPAYGAWAIVVCFVLPVLFRFS